MQTTSWSLSHPRSCVNCTQSEWPLSPVNPLVLSCSEKTPAPFELSLTPPNSWNTNVIVAWLMAPIDESATRLVDPSGRGRRASSSFERQGLASQAPARC